MPTPAEILAGLTAIAHQWTEVAIGWHVAVALALIALVLGWRPTQRTARALIAILPGSAAAFALAYGNLFNGALLAATTIALVTLADRDGDRAVGGALAPWRWSGAAMIAFGWAYPHFGAGGAIAYLYAAPLGLVPCPSLSMAIGLALLAGGEGARAWRLVLAGVGAFYGAFGALRLGVTIDVVLLAGASALALSTLRQSSAATSGTGRHGRGVPPAAPSPSPSR
jgi:hypothetical protein